MPIFDRVVADPARPGDSSVIDQQVKLRPASLQPLAEIPPFFDAADVEMFDEAVAPRLADELQGLFIGRIVDVGEAQVPTVACQPQRDRASQTAGGAGNQPRLSLFAIFEGHGRSFVDGLVGKCAIDRTTWLPGVRAARSWRRASGCCRSGFRP